MGEEKGKEKEKRDTVGIGMNRENQLIQVSGFEVIQQIITIASKKKRE